MYIITFQGFHRYSVDAEWHLPHFEKMLYDQAQLAAIYLDGYVVSWFQNINAISISFMNATIDKIPRVTNLRGITKY